MLCNEWQSTVADRQWVKAALAVLRTVKACDGNTGPANAAHVPIVKAYLCVPVPIDQVRDYTNVIFHRQDLGTIEKNLKDNGYASPDDWIAAMRTVFRNVFVYNKPDGGIGSIILAAADCASHVFEKELLRLRGITVI